MEGDNLTMSLRDVGLGNVLLKSKGGQDIVMRLSVSNDILHISFLDGEEVVVTLVVEDDYELSQIVSLLETCYDHI